MPALVASLVPAEAAWQNQVRPPTEPASAFRESERGGRPDRSERFGDIWMAGAPRRRVSGPPRLRSPSRVPGSAPRNRRRRTGTFRRSRRENRRQRDPGQAADGAGSRPACRALQGPGSRRRDARATTMAGLRRPSRAWLLHASSSHDAVGTAPDQRQPPDSVRTLRFESRRWLELVPRSPTGVLLAGDQRRSDRRAK